MCKKLIYLTSFVLVLVAVPSVAHAQVDNLAINPSFEEDEVILNDQAYEHWWTWGWEDGLNSTVEIDETEFIDGTRSLKVNPIGSTNWYFIVANSPMPVEVGTNYTASFWAKAEEPRPLGARFKATDNSVDWGYTDFEVTTEWAEYSMTSEAINAELKFEIFCAGVEVPLWLDFVYVYEGEYVAGIAPAEASPPVNATAPVPADGAYLEDTWGNFSWTPGALALSHDVYLGDNYDDVNDGAEGTFRGNQVATFFIAGFPGFPYPDGLIPGTTYYWRIDEVNDTEPNSPWKGDVWSFSVPPKTAYLPDPADNAESVHSNYDLSWMSGFGAKLHTVYFGDNFDEVNNATGGLSTGVTTYDPGPLKLAKTYYWRVDEFDVIDTYKGHVWSFITEGAVGSPNPSNGAVDIKHTPILTWTPGVYGASHKVYFGTDKDAVKYADTGSPEYKDTGDLGAESFDPGKLQWDTTYYWRIDEANNANPESPWAGPLWSFTTANFLIVDDFESYNDIDPPDPESNRIFEAWLDGYEIPTNGALVGNELPPYAEQSIVHSGNQSMPYFYDNSVGNSEATHTLTYPRDWTENGVNTLTIWFRGDSANAAETLYVVLNGRAVVNHDNPNAAQITTWTEWNIDLSAPGGFADQGVNLANVNTIGIGFGNRSNPVAGGSGTMYFDDIRLYPPAP
ncbi:MAG: carbohydrate binding domain-containing protein [Phycisphaerae bacterium]